MTDTVRALADTYNIDFREAINAANTLMTQFGINGEEAINLIKDGMQGMIIGDGGKLLTMIQQYAPAFRDAGISASQLVAVIHNTEGGIFTDENMNAIVQAIKNIRLMKDTTKDALRSIGIDGDAMAKQLNDGTITLKEFLSIYRENYKPENNFLLQIGLNDWVWFKSHLKDSVYLNKTSELEKYEFMFTKIKGIRQDADPGVVVNFIKSIYAMYQNRDTLFEESLQTNVDLIFDSIYRYLKEEC